jgi:hypothetical protein
MILTGNEKYIVFQMGTGDNRNGENKLTLIIIKQIVTVVRQLH